MAASKDSAHGMLRSWLKLLVPGRTNYHRALKAHHAGRLAGHYAAVPADTGDVADAEPARIHFWTPYSWPSREIHVERVLPHLRASVAARRLPWHITGGPDLPSGTIDWLLCLKALPPRQGCAAKRQVLLLNDDADRVWSRLRRFDHVVVVSSPTLASLVGTVHPRVWFMEETESLDAISQGESALSRCPPSGRSPVLLWHGTKESLDGLLPLRDALAAFSRDPARNWRW